MIPRWILFLLIIFLLPSASFSQALFAEETPTKTDARETVFRYMFKHYKYGADVKFYCVGVERPLPEIFLRRFSQINPSVVWASECENSGPMNSVRNKKTGERGLLMIVKSIRWVNGQEAEASVEAFSDGIAVNWNILRVVLAEGHWKVVKDTASGVS